MNNGMSRQDGGKVDIKNLGSRAFESFITSLGEKPYRSRQIMRWIYQSGATSFDQMTNLPKTLRGKLEEVSFLGNFKPHRVESSPDGSRKILFTLHDGHQIESVLIPEKRHRTICVSTQVGCALGCTFCLSGKHGLIRNLSTSEIINQVCAIKQYLLQGDETINLVFMGMGEPLANYTNTLAALYLLTDPNGFNLSHRRITVSTAGIIPGIRKLGRDLPVNLAISLNAPTNRLRNSLMPVNKTYPIEKLLSCASKAILPPRKRITFEYILIAGVNDSQKDARALAGLLKDIRCKINLIPINEHPETGFRRPGSETIEHFRECLVSRNFTAVVRYSKGSDISAACGQLGFQRRQGCCY